MSKGPKMKNLNERSVRILASLGLILTTMIWGFAFVVMKNSVDLIPPTYLLAIRFSMSAVLLALLFIKICSQRTARRSSAARSWEYSSACPTSSRLTV